jgi:N-acetyl-1-D-myo-inositol-2-amino-2-deoxy-alpha-D-glucopyranoside deacetylase
MEQTEQRLLVLHARPGDEAALSGGLIARSVQDGATVTVVTATRGEAEPVLPADLRYLQAASDELASFRAGETAQAMIALGGVEHRFLGGAGAREPGSAVHRYREGGAGAAGPADAGGDAVTGVAPAAGDVAGTLAGTLAAAAPERVAADVFALIQELRPHAIVTDGTDLVTASPDATRLRSALQLAWRWCQQREDAWTPLTIFAVEQPRGALQRQARLLGQRGLRAPRPRGGVPDRLISVAFDVRAVRPAAAAALACYRSRFAVADGVVTDVAGVSRLLPAYVYLREIGAAARYAPGGVAPGPVQDWVPLAAAAPGAWFEPPAMSRGARLLEFALLAAFGLLTGAIGTAVHRSAWYSGGAWGTGAAVPLGLIVAALVCFVTVLSLRLARRRALAFTYAVGVFVAVAILALPSPGGSALIVADWRGVVWMYVVPILTVLLSVLGRPPARR